MRMRSRFFFFRFASVPEPGPEFTLPYRLPYILS